MINKNLERAFPSSDKSYKDLVSESKWDKTAMLKESVRPSFSLRCLILGDIDNCDSAVFFENDEGRNHSGCHESK